MLNDFGHYLRDYRISQGMLLYDMAKELGVSSAFLSGCECGRHPIPDFWKERLPLLYPTIDGQKLEAIISEINRR